MEEERKAVCEYYKDCVGYSEKYCPNCKHYTFKEEVKEVSTNA